MKKSVFQSIISFLILVIVVSVCGVFKTSVGLKLETANLNECISIISGKNLCQQLFIFKIVIIVSLLMISGIFSLKISILRL